MNDEQTIDGLLRDAMAGDAPRLSAEFDERVMRAVRPRTLSPLGVVVLAVYAVVAIGVLVWVMRGIPAQSIVAGGAIGIAVAASASAYARRLTLRRF